MAFLVRLLLGIAPRTNFPRARLDLVMDSMLKVGVKPGVVTFNYKYPHYIITVKK